MKSRKIVAGIDKLYDVFSFIDGCKSSGKHIILLRGDLASGKTTLVKRYAMHIGINDEVTSPTFSLQSVYANVIYHYDIYNKSSEEFISLGLLDEFEKEGIHFIEWADEKLEKVLVEFGFKVAKIYIKPLDNDKREYECID